MSVYADNNNDIQDLLQTEGSAFYWLPRYSTTPNATYGLTWDADPHLPTGIARCPRCFNSTLQRPQSSICTICYGTTWTGGFGAGGILTAIATLGTYRLQMQETGELMAVQGEWLYSMAGDALILPQDLIILAQVPSVRYLVGELGNTPGVLTTPIVRINQLLPQAPDSPWQLVPIP
jgi:hypothetical protein